MAGSGRFSEIKHFPTAIIIISLFIILIFFFCLPQEWDIGELSWDVQECGTERVSILRENLWVPDVQIAEL